MNINFTGAVKLKSPLKNKTYIKLLLPSLLKPQESPVSFIQCIMRGVHGNGPYLWEYP